MNTNKKTNTFVANLKKTYDKNALEVLTASVIVFSSLGATNGIASDKINSVYDINHNEVTIGKMFAEVFKPNPNTVQYVLDPNSNKNIITLNDTNFSIQDKVDSFGINVIVEGGTKFVDTMSNKGLKESLQNLYSQYKDSLTLGDDVNNAKRISKIDEKLVDFEKDKDKLEQKLSLTSDLYYKADSKLKTQYTNILQKTIDIDSKNLDKNNLAKVENIFKLKEEIFNKREIFLSSSINLQDEDKKILQKEINELRQNVNIEYKNLPRTLVYAFNKYDTNIDLLEKYNNKIESLEIETTKIVDQLVDAYSERTQLANSDQIVNFRDDVEFKDAIREHVKSQETSVLGGGYGVAKDIKDKAGISFGAYQLTEASGFLKKFMKEAAQENSEAKTLYQKFKGNNFTGPDSQLISFLEKFGPTEAGKKIQENMFEKYFMEKAFNIIDRHEITDKQSIGTLVDHYLNTGPKGLNQLIAKCKGDFSPENVIAMRPVHYKGIAEYKDAQEANSGSVYIDGWLNRAAAAAENFEQFSDANQIAFNKNNNINLDDEIKKNTTSNSSQTVENYMKYYKILDNSKIDKDINNSDVDKDLDKNIEESIGERELV